MKHKWFIVLTGLGGALGGVVTFLLAGRLTTNLPIQAATGGLVAVVLPILIVLLFYPTLIGGDTEDE